MLQIPTKLHDLDKGPVKTISIMQLLRQAPGEIFTCDFVPVFLERWSAECEDRGPVLSRFRISYEQMMAELCPFLDDTSDASHFGKPLSCKGQMLPDCKHLVGD